jgi:hypothetical protein
MRRQRRVDAAFRFRRPAGNQGEVLLLDEVVLELMRDVLLGGFLANSRTPLVSLSSRWTMRNRGSGVPDPGILSCPASRSRTLSVSPRPGIVARPAGLLTAT